MSIEIDGWSRALHVPRGSRATWLLWRIGWVMTRLWAWFVPPQQPKPHLILSTRPGESDFWLHACSCKKMQNHANIYFVPSQWKIRNEFSSLHYGDVRMETPTGEALHSSSFKITKISLPPPTYLSPSQYFPTLNKKILSCSRGYEPRVSWSWGQHERFKDAHIVSEIIKRYPDPQVCLSPGAVVLKVRQKFPGG